MSDKSIKTEALRVLEAPENDDAIRHLVTTVEKNNPELSKALSNFLLRGETEEGIVLADKRLITPQGFL